MAYHQASPTCASDIGGAHASSAIPTDCVEDSPRSSDKNFQSLKSVVNGLNDSSLAISALATAPTSDLSSTSIASTSNRSSLTSLSSLSTSSSETVFHESDEGLDSETDVDKDICGEDMKNGTMYSYRLLPALAMPSFATGPSTMDAPWPYTFKKGCTAFARGGNGTWRRVTLLDSGVVSPPRDDEDAPEPRALVYTAQWVDASGQTFRASFCPTRGDLKPDDTHVRRLLARESGMLQLQSKATRPDAI